ncbi:hypothetical protein [Lentiprolixibacter aurantiacus]|uniref:Aspartyl protease n=1 Tax=Lentiprolixibacter aurantiacus TaxID=2993939 RepID=A0AAE3MKV8_9FLAO|nr:hypothetical protein [Lentiprolixibacter aurantiacus]MCX2719630.1 hypothetical protein [Lentiprolixibacter aurantiacus]
MKLKNQISLILLSLGLVLFVQCQERTTSASADQTVAILVKTVNTRDFSKIEDLLADNYQYQEYGNPMASNILKQVIIQYPEIRDYEIISTSYRDNEIGVEVNFTTEKGREKKLIQLDKDHKLLRADIASITLAGHPEKKDNQSSSENISKEPFEEISFQLTGTGHMIVEASVNGRKANFIVDSGTAGQLMLNAEYYDMAGSTSQNMPMGVTGKMQGVRELIVDQFVWNNMEFKELDAHIAEISHLGRNIGVENFGGTIGYGILKDFAMDLDYKQGILKLWRDTEAMRGTYGITKDRTLPMSMAMHIPIIEVNIADKIVKLGIDSGAEGNMLNKEWEVKLNGSYNNIRKDKLGGAENNYVTVTKVSLNDIQICKNEYEMDFIFADLFGGNHKVNLLDGLIGYPFLSAQQTILNLKDNEICLLNKPL